MTFIFEALRSDLSRALPPGLANPAAASLAAAGGVQRAVQENFLRRGGKSFWQQAAELTKVSPAGADGAQVSVYRRGVALRLLGGRVQAKPGHAMALPVKRGDSDLWPREIPGLSLVRWRSGGKVRAGLARDGRLMFTFIKAATHKPDSTVLPGPASLATIPTTPPSPSHSKNHTPLTKKSTASIARRISQITNRK